MKKLVLIIAFLAAVSVQAQEHWRSGFTVGVEGNFTLKDHNGDVEWREFKGSTISGGYKWYAVKGLFIKPTVSFYYERHDFDIQKYSWDCVWIDNNGQSHGCPSIIKEEGNHSMEFGIGVSAIVGYTVPTSRIAGLEFFTGPYYSFGIDQHVNINAYKRSNEYNRSSLRWKFGIGMNIWRINVNVSYDCQTLKLKDYSNQREFNVLSVGLGYNF